jgi:hypothetical protein
MQTVPQFKGMDHRTSLQVLLCKTPKSFKFQMPLIYTREASSVHSHVIQGRCRVEAQLWPLNMVIQLENLVRCNHEKTSVFLATVILYHDNILLHMAQRIQNLVKIQLGNTGPSPICSQFGSQVIFICFPSCWSTWHFSPTVKTSNVPLSHYWQNRDTHTKCVQEGLTTHWDKYFYPDGD